MSKNNSIIKLKNIFDTMVLISLVSLFILELCKIVKLNFNNKLVFDMIVVLLPATITIVSISLSLTKEKICGVYLNDFIKLRSKSVYSFPHMVLIMSISIALYTVFYMLSATMTIVLLDFFAFCYSIIFSIQEIPVLIQDKKRLNKIIRYAYDNINKTELFLIQNETNTLYRVIQYIVLNDGIVTAFNSLKKNRGKEIKEYNSKLIEHLLSIQNDYFMETTEDIEVLTMNLNGEYKNIELIKAINNAYSNVEIVLSNKDIIESDEDFNTNTISHLIKSIFALHRLCNSLKLEGKETNKLKIITSSILLADYSVNKRQKSMYTFALIMSVITLNDGDIWFIKQLRDNNLCSTALFFLDKCTLGLFISIFISHILGGNIINDEKKAEIIAFLNEPAEGLNSYGISWNRLLANQIEFTSSKLLTNSLTKLINIYRLVNPTQFTPFRSGATFDISQNFDEGAIINAWLEIILFMRSYNIDLVDFKNVIATLNQDAKSKLIDTLSQKWIVDNGLNEKYQTSFLNYFNFYKVPINENYCNKEFIEYLANYRKDYYMNKVMREISNADTDVKKMKSLIKEKFDKMERENEFLDDKIDLMSENSFSFKWQLENKNLNELLSQYLDQLPDLFSMAFKKEIQSAISPNLIENYKLTDEQFKEIYDFNPDKRSHFYGLINNSSDELSKIEKNVCLSESKILPFNFYFKDGAIKINIEYDEESSDIRFLNDDEVNNIIDTEYQVVNGLYRYSEFSKDVTKSFLVTREELKNFLSKEIIYVLIVFKKKIVIDKCKCIWYDLKEE